MTATEEETYSDDKINDLPDELIIGIFKFLPLDDILVCENVCQRWKKLTQDSSLWKNITIVYSGKPGETEVSTRNLDIIESHCEYLCCLRIQYVYSYPVITSILEKCNRLVSLALIMCRIGKEFLKDVVRWPNLRKLSLKNSILLQTGQDLNIQFDLFKNLRSLTLSDFGLNSLNCNSLLHCKYLSRIYIEKIKDLNIEFIEALISSKQDILEELHIYGGDAISDECMKLLAKCPVLEDLGIIRCENLTDVGLLALTSSKSLRQLLIWNNSNFTEASLLRTLGHPNLITLVSLSLSRISNISPVIVDVISEYYKNLKFLALYQCPRIINTDYEKQLKSKFRNIDVVLY